MMPKSRDEYMRGLVTRSSLACSLRAAGIRQNDTICAHVSLSRLGYVVGAAQTVIEAIFDAVGAAGTVMMPAFSGEMSDPSEWRAPPVPVDWIESIRNEMPAFDEVRTPSRQMGVVAELFRNWPGTLRSSHPHSSFVACGPRAIDLVEGHSLNYRFGLRSPIGKLAALGGKIILLGAGPERASVVYLAQYMSGIGAEISKAAPMLVDGVRQWVVYKDIAVDNRLVSSGVQFLLREGIARSFPVGDTQVTIFMARDALSALVAWGWRDVGFECAIVRPPTAVPEDWR